MTSIAVISSGFTFLPVTFETGRVGARSSLSRNSLECAGFNLLKRLFALDFFQRQSYLRTLIREVALITGCFILMQGVREVAREFSYDDDVAAFRVGKL
jgi:hypothetical protein